MSHSRRCSRAARALNAYAGGELPDYREPWEQDLITDLLHLIDARGGSAEDSLRIAAMHYQAERGWSYDSGTD
jgi:hypothetical protein